MTVRLGDHPDCYMAARRFLALFVPKSPKLVIVGETVCLQDSPKVDVFYRESRLGLPLGRRSNNDYLMGYTAMLKPNRHEALKPGQELASEAAAFAEQSGIYGRTHAKRDGAVIEEPRVANVYVKLSY